MRFRHVGCGLMIGLALGCTTSPDPATERDALLAADSAWAAAAESGDIDKLSTYWAQDATNYFPGAPVAQGKESILELVARNRGMPGFALTWHATEAEVSAAADLGYTTGPFELTVRAPDGTDQVQTGHYVAIWRKGSTGQWECVVESSIFGPGSALPGGS